MAKAWVTSVARKDEWRDGHPPLSADTIIDVACAVLDLDEALTKGGVPYEKRAPRLAHARAVLCAWAAGATTTESTARELMALLSA
jgi:hypothetical protein